MRVYAPEGKYVASVNGKKCAAGIEILNGVLPDQGVVIAFVFDGADEVALCNSLLLQDIGHVDLGITDRTGDGCIFRGRFFGIDLAGTLGAANLHHIIEVFPGMYGLFTYRADCLFALSGIDHNLVAAMGAFFRYKAILSNVNDPSAGTMNGLFRKEGIGRRMHCAAYGTFDYKIAHRFRPPDYLH